MERGGKRRSRTRTALCVIVLHAKEMGSRALYSLDELAKAKGSEYVPVPLATKLRLPQFCAVAPPSGSLSGAPSLVTATPLVMEQLMVDRSMLKTVGDTLF